MRTKTTGQRFRAAFEPARLKRLGLNLGLLTLGSVIIAVAINGIVVPKQFLTGGLMGLTLILHYLSPILGIGLVYALLNIPMILLGWISVSRRFIFYTGFGIAVFSLAMEFIVPPPFQVENLLLASILGGVLTGLGSGLVFRSAGSLGGLDILAVWANKKWNIRVGPISMAGNGLVLIAGAVVFSLEMALYAMIYTFVTAKVMDQVLTGFNTRKQVMIISDKAREIAQEIITKRRRGVTFLQGEGAYTGRRKEVALTIVTLTELARIKNAILEIDPAAFIIINETLEVLGKRHGTKRVY